jgi:MoaA/NifB/PqqE/SkfB family radical SAM enzyme
MLKSMLESHPRSSQEFIPIIQSLHIEPSSYCNAKCLGCSRTSDMNSKIESPLRPAHLDLDQLLQTLQSPTLKKLDYLYLCGVIGDPMAHPHLTKFLQDVYRSWPNMRTVIHTNGSLGTEKIWKQLGELSHHHNLKVYFSIDGLEDTNHLYRHQVPWNPIMDNAKSFISSGGKAIWKFIRFPSNRHQITEAEKRAEEMGFIRFETREPYDEERVPTVETLDRALSRKPKAQPFSALSTEELGQRVSKTFKEIKKIDCQSQRENQLYIDAYGQVWPCCWVGNLGLSRRSFFEREYFWRTTLSHYPENFNSLLHHPFESIIRSPWYQKELVQSWGHGSQDKKPCISACNKHCGVR